MPMIKFFRKIRQKLLAENRVTRYLAYAVGENNSSSDRYPYRPSIKHPKRRE
jgi:hypothetical protein